MLDEVKTDEQLQREAKQKEELRLGAQTPYDARKHGLGTTPISEPQSVKEMFQYVKTLEARISVLESKTY